MRIRDGKNSGPDIPDPQHCQQQPAIRGNARLGGDNVEVGCTQRLWDEREGDGQHQPYTVSYWAKHQLEEQGTWR